MRLTPEQYISIHPEYTVLLARKVLANIPFQYSVQESPLEGRILFKVGDIEIFGHHYDRDAYKYILSHGDSQERFDKVLNEIIDAVNAENNQVVICTIIGAPTSLFKTSLLQKAFTFPVPPNVPYNYFHLDLLGISVQKNDQEIVELFLKAGKWHVMDKYIQIAEDNGHEHLVTLLTNHQQNEG